MTPPTPDNLESQLRELTSHRGEPQNLWQKALDQEGKDQPPSSWIDRLRTMRINNRAVLAGVACVGLIVITAVMLPSLRPTRSMSPTLMGAHGPALSKAAPSSMPYGAEALKPGGLRQGMTTWADSTDGPVRIEGGVTVDRLRAPAEGFEARQGRGSIERSDDTDRSVIQKATIDLQTPDVRAAFAKASYLISSAGGEFVENSALTGEGKTAQANLTLRVGAVRLSEVLNSLRELGKVQSEKTTGEDVTSQVVDLEARLRNEQRIEKELLELLDKRADAPLKDILELRSSLSAVRQTIEQYIAQRDGLNHLVSLASILVVIRAEPEAAPKPEPAQSLTTYFLHGISETWHDGLRSLADSISWLLSILIRGTLFWLFLAAIVFAVYRNRRRLAARCV